VDLSRSSGTAFRFGFQVPDQFFRGVRVQHPAFIVPPPGAPHWPAVHTVNDLDLPPGPLALELADDLVGAGHRDLRPISARMPTMRPRGSFPRASIGGDVRGSRA
jgi:hypothetical protein